MSRTPPGDGDRPAPGLGLRLFDLVLGVGNLGLLFATVVAVPLAWLAFTGRGTFTLDAEVDPPYTVELAGGRAVQVNGGTGAWINFPIGDEHRYLEDEPSVRAPVKVDREDTDARVVLAAGVSAWLALVWLGLVNVRRIVRSALAGRAFDAGNVARLRWLALAVLTFPLVTRVTFWALDARIDVDPPVHLLTPGPNWWVYAIGGVGVLALAEIFREGSRLRELEEATV